MDVMVETNFKPEPQPCACGCGLTGSPKKNGHIKRSCKCISCRNGRNSKRGKRSQREFQKTAGIKQAAFRGANGNEESWRDHFRWEHKDGAQVRPVVTAYLRCKTQADSSLAIGDPRPFALGVTVGKLRLVVIDAEDWNRHIVPLLDEYGGVA